jgi:regulator of cell morphogenesis and NO signaling
MGTATLEQTVGQLVTERPSRAKVFETFGIDYCCGGKQPLKQACEKKGISASVVLNVLNLLDEKQAPAERDWSSSSLAALCEHIETTHHAYLKQELPRVQKLADRVADRHGDHQPHLLKLRDVFTTFREELEAHMAKEELVLFPLIRALETSDRLPEMHCGSVANPIRRMVHEHDDAGEAMRLMRELTGNYVPPPEACNTYRALYAALEEIEQDMHRHVHKENSILFPRAEAVEVKLRAGL